MAKQIEAPALHHVDKELMPKSPPRQFKMPDIISITATNLDAPGNARLFSADFIKLFKVLFILNKYKILNKTKGNSIAKNRIKGEEKEDCGAGGFTPTLYSELLVILSIFSVFSLKASKIIPEADAIEKMQKIKVKIKMRIFTIFIIFIPDKFMEREVLLKAL